MDTSLPTLSVKGKLTPEKWQRMKEILATALTISDRSERDAYVEQACLHDYDLHREVERYLDQTTAAFDECAEYVTNDSGEPASGRFGAYEIVRELGRGGMGTVWLARRADQQFNRLVAIKLLKRGTDTDEVLRRFESERQILAQLDHPNIARLLDAGTTPDGLPYFVMEHVAGSRLTDYAFAENLNIRDRLELFLKICSAVQFAHQNLVVHRDLKPANILVTAEGEPKLLDFGIAKLLAAADAGWEMTMAGGERLTPGYASPEQVRGEPVTTVSDVYALGALLYELLAEAPAHRFSAARPATAELLRVICEQEPKRPSLAAANAETRRQLRGDLDNIVLRALTKAPDRRYRGASHLADDLRRYLQNRPVRARPDTIGYRTGKFLLRNKAGVAIGVAVAGALLTAGIVVVWEERREHRRFEEVRRLAESFLFEFDDAIAKLPGATPARRLIVERALQHLDGLAHEAGNDTALQLDLAEAYLKVGNVQGRPYSPNIGDSPGALKSYAKAVEIAEPLAQREHGSAPTRARTVLADAYEALGIVNCRLENVGAATQSYQRALAIREQLLKEDSFESARWLRGIVSSRLGLGDAIMAGNHLHENEALYRAALVYYREALPICERVAAATQSDPVDAFRLMQTCARIASMLSEIAALRQDKEMFREAFLFHDRTLSLDQTALAREPESVLFRRNFAGELVMSAYARVLANEQLEQAEAQNKEGLKLQDALAAADPANAEAQQDLALAYYVNGRICQLKGDTAEAEKAYQKCIAVLEPLTRAHSENVETAYDLQRARTGLLQVTGKTQSE